MTLPKPEIGLVVQHSYLWASEHASGAEDGVKNRPCAIVAATRSFEDKIVVTVFPITHTHRVIEIFTAARQARRIAPVVRTD